MKKATILLTLLFLLNFSNTDVHADSPDYNIDDVIENMKSVNSSQEDIESVLEKLEKGETLDSDKDIEELSLEIEESDLQLSKYGILNTDSLEDKTVDFVRFEDGSFQELTLEVENQNNDMISILSGNGGTIRFRPTLRHPYIIVSYSADIFIPNDTRSGSIITGMSSVEDASFTSIIGTYSNRKRNVIRRAEIQSSKLPASGSFSWDHTFTQGAGKRSQSLTIQAGHHIGGQYGVRVLSTPSGITSY